MKTNTVILAGALAVSLAGCGNVIQSSAEVIEGVDINITNAKLERLERAERLACEAMDIEVVLQRYKDYDLRVAYMKICNFHRNQKHIPKSARE